MRALQDISELYRAVVGVYVNHNLAGTGFFIGDAGLVVTTAHGITPDREALPGIVQLASRSPTGAEVRGEAEVLRDYCFRDDAIDLALLRVCGEPPRDALWLEPAAIQSLADPLHGFGYPTASPGGLGAKASPISYLPNPPRLQFRSEQTQPGYSGGPLIDSERGCVVAMIQSRLTGSPDSFAVPIEWIGAALTTAHVCAPSDERLDPAITSLLDLISRRIGPRSAWPSAGAEYGAGAAPLLRPGDAQTLSEAALRCLGAAPDGEVLLLLPTLARAMIRARIGAGDDWRQALVEVCSARTWSLRLLAAILNELGRPEAPAFDRRVRDTLHLRYTDGELREIARKLRHLDKTTLRSVAAEVGVHTLPGFHEARGASEQVLWFVRSVASLTPTADALERVLQHVANGALVDGPPPAAVEPQLEECVLLVELTENTSGRASAKFVGLPRPGEQRILGEWEGPSIRDQALLDELQRAISQLRDTWEVTTERVSIEFALPRKLLCEQVEQWLLWRKHPACEPLGVSYQVVLRSWDRLYDRRLQDYWADWRQKWCAFTASPSLRRIDRSQRDDPGALEGMILGAHGIALDFPHDLDHADDDDPIRMCIDGMVPVALWCRGGDGEPIPPHPPEDQLHALRAWVWRQRRRARRAPELACNTIVLMWDDPNRIPVEARARRENLSRRKTQ